MIMSAYYVPNSMKYKAPFPLKPQQDLEQVAAGFLLSLKHSRSVTPEPPTDDSLDPHVSYQSFAATVRRRETCDSRPDTQSRTSVPRVQSPAAEAPASVSADNINIQEFIAESQIVHMKDQDLVPDALFIAMAQMKPCKLTHADRVGCYKDRELGFLGMCCKHCGGQPGFGRYFPNSVRSLAQTTTSQTILKHIASKCRFCPPEVRNAVSQLQDQASLCDGARPRYGSRKIFFQRVWSRLHKIEARFDESTCQAEDDASTETPTDVDESSTATDVDRGTGFQRARESLPSQKRKSRGSSLFIEKIKRQKNSSL